MPWLPLFAVALALPVEATEPRIRVLIVDGFSNHDWRLTTRLIRAVIEPTGLFEVAVSTAPPTQNAAGWDGWHPRFADYDVVIQNCNDIKAGPPWPADVRTAFEEFVRQGGGTYIWHSANNAFADWPAYNEIIGLGWRAKDQGDALQIGDDLQIIRIPSGEGHNTGHGPRVDALIHRLGDHPIHRGLPRVWRTANTEIYYYARGPAKNLEVLSWTEDELRTQKRWPMEWTVTYGKGRVYVSTFGHVWRGDVQPVTLRCAGVQTLTVRALQWLARRPVSFPVPTDFPTADAPSIRPELALP